MSFKDKLKTIKKGNKPVKKAPKVSADNTEENSGYPSLNSIKEDVPTGNKKQSKLSARSGKKSAIKQKAVRTRVKKSGDNNLKKNIALALILLLLIIAAGLFFFKDMLFGSDDVAPPIDPIPVQQPVKPSEDNLEGDTSLSNNNTDTTSSTTFLIEEIDQELPDTEVAAAEEIDLLADESIQLEKQEEELNQLIVAKEELITLQDMKVAMLEQKIAEALANEGETPIVSTGEQESTEVSEEEQESDEGSENKEEAVTIE